MGILDNSPPGTRPREQAPATTGRSPRLRAGRYSTLQMGILNNPPPGTRPREQASAMTDRPPPSVCQQLADLHAYRLRTMAPADVQVNIDQRQLLEDTADRAAFVKAGDVVEPFSLPEVHGGTIELARLLAGGPGVLLFFRYEGCPACNIALRHYQLELYPALADLGVTLVAISPQVPDKLVAIKNRFGFGFGFPVVSDTGN